MSICFQFEFFLFQNSKWQIHLFWHKCLVKQDQYIRQHRKSAKMNTCVSKNTRKIDLVFLVMKQMLDSTSSSNINKKASGIIEESLRNWGGIFSVLVFFSFFKETQKCFVFLMSRFEFIEFADCFWEKN